MTAMAVAPVTEAAPLPFTVTEGPLSVSGTVGDVFVADGLSLTFSTSGLIGDPCPGGSVFGQEGNAIASGYLTLRRRRHSSTVLLPLGTSFTHPSWDRAVSDRMPARPLGFSETTTPSPYLYLSTLSRTRFSRLETMNPCVTTVDSRGAHPSFFHPLRTFASHGPSDRLDVGAAAFIAALS